MIIRLGLKFSYHLKEASLLLSFLNQHISLYKFLLLCISYPTQLAYYWN